MTHVQVRWVNGDIGRHIITRSDHDPRIGVQSVEIGGPETSVVGGSDDGRYRLYGYTLHPHTSERVES